MNKKSLARLAAAVSLGTGLAVVASLPAQAGGGGGSSSQGQCSMGSSWELKGSPDHGKVEVEARVETGMAGQMWDWQILDNGTVAKQGQSTTRDDSNGRFEVRRRVDNAVGPDTIMFQASNAASGETCDAQVVVHGRS